jgi:hypothetical protein
MKLVHPIRVASLISVVLLFLVCSESEACKLFGRHKNCYTDSNCIPCWASYIEIDCDYSTICNLAKTGYTCCCCQDGTPVRCGPTVKCDTGTCVLVPNNADGSPGPYPPCSSYSKNPTFTLNSSDHCRIYAMICDPCTHRIRFALPCELYKAFYGNYRYWLGHPC